MGHIEELRAVIARGQEQYPHVRSSHRECSFAGMVDYADKSPEASKLKADQSRRLRWLREQMGLLVIDAAKIAGVNRWAWGRMEGGKTLIDTVALARFLSYRNYSADYVVSGRTAGLPDDLAYDLQTLARKHLATVCPGAAKGCISADPERVISGKRLKRNKAGSES